MPDKIRVGLVGANPEGSWGSRAHIPALKGLPEYELKAICTAHEDTATRAAAAFGAELAFHDFNRMVAEPAIDLVAVAVRVPYHHEITMAALRAGKDVYCEWPLGATTGEAQEMADLARERGVRTMVGLQARSDPALTHLRRLIADGYVGDVGACHMTMITQGALERPAARAWQADRANGANTMTIAGGHNIDALCFCLGEFVEVSAKVATQIKQVRLSDTGATIEATSPDNILFSGVLAGGALASVHVASVPFSNETGWRLDVFGRNGTITAAAGQANYAEKPISLMGRQGSEGAAELPVPDDLTVAPEATLKGAPFNVAQAYTRFADGSRGGAAVDPDFDLAVQRHRLLAALEQSSAEGRTVKLT